MPEGDTRPFPSRSKKKGPTESARISENLHVFLATAQQRYEEGGRGGIAVCTTQRPSGKGHPYGCVPQAMVG